MEVVERLSIHFLSILITCGGKERPQPRGTSVLISGSLSLTLSLEAKVSSCRGRAWGRGCPNGTTANVVLWTPRGILVYLIMLAWGKIWEAPSPLCGPCQSSKLFHESIDVHFQFLCKNLKCASEHKLELFIALERPMEGAVAPPTL